MKDERNEEGQSLVLIALGLVVLLGFMALVVDGGNVYAQRRQVQNAVDAASTAGAERLTRHNPSNVSNPNQRATNGQVFDSVKKYLVANGVPVDPLVAPEANLKVYYVVRISATATKVVEAQVTSYGTGLAAPLKISVNGTLYPVIGVDVTVDRKFNSFFAGVLGIRTMQVGARAPSYGAPILNNATPGPETTGSCCADDLFPIAINSAMFSDLDGDGNLDVTYEEATPSKEFQLWERTATSPNFVYVTWNTDRSATTLDLNMDDVTRSGTKYVQDKLLTSTATMASSSVVRGDLQASVGKTYTVAVYDSGPDANGKVSVVGFARFQITGVCRSINSFTGTCSVALNTSGSGAYLQGRFEQWSSSRCEGSCSFFGVRTNKSNPEPPQERALIGVVKLNVHELTNVSFEQTPVDVVHVLDISGSMDSCIDSPSTNCDPTKSGAPANYLSRWKLKAAKDALITFNGVVSPTLGDRIGLATFPVVDGSKSGSYSKTCGGSYGEYLKANNNANLTNNIGAKTAPFAPTGSVNYKINALTADNGTPLAQGLQLGREMVLDPTYHVASHQPVLVVASDGIANFTLDGKWTGFAGTTYEDLPCNSLAVADAVAQGNLAKQDNNHDGKPDVIVFTIAIGNNFNSASLEAIASEPSSSHYFPSVTNASQMQSIYTQIATVLQNGDCTASDHTEFGAGATVRVKNTTTNATYTTTATATGYFEFRNVPVGTYEFQSVSVTIGGMTYDIFTDGVGGPILETKPSIEVSDLPRSYPINISLETDDFTGSCP